MPPRRSAANTMWGRIPPWESNSWGGLGSLPYSTAVPQAGAPIQRTGYQRAGARERPPASRPMASSHGAPWGEHDVFNRRSIGSPRLCSGRSLADHRLRTGKRWRVAIAVSFASDDWSIASLENDDGDLRSGKPYMANSAAGVARPRPLPQPSFS
jgi:hypothetical protein